MKTAALLLALTSAACASVPVAGVAVTGQWGGPHIGLTLEPSGGRIEYDCAAGTVGQIVPDSGGGFTAAGTHTPGWGGPEIAGRTLTTHDAQFSGRIAGDTMNLRGRANGVEFGPFTLTRGAEPGIFRCL